MVARAESPPQDASDEPQLPRFYAGRSVFITGASGFMGKVLVERLLSTCPGIARLHLLLRSKRGACPQKRLQQLRQSPVFAAVRARCPEQLDKLCAVPGDAALPALGLAQAHVAQLREVSVVIHLAASIRFTEPLEQAVTSNVRSLMYALDVADQLPALEVFVHVSTAYSNTEQRLVEERVYPAPVAPAQLLALVEAAPAHILAAITDQYIAPKPNTYTFTKAVAESVLLQRARRYPAGIFRPSIVVASSRAPLAGWGDNAGGPAALALAAGRGLLHAVRARAAGRCHLLPADHAADCLLAAAWELATDRPQDVRVYNCTSAENPLTWAQFRDGVVTSARLSPLDDAFSYPYTIFFENKFVYNVMEMLMQTLPLYIAECGARLWGLKHGPSLSLARRRLRQTAQAFEFFTLHEWRFASANVRRLRGRLARSDGHLYNLDINDLDWSSYLAVYMKGIRKYLLREKDEDLPAAKLRMARLRILHYCGIAVLALLFLRFMQLMWNMMM